MNNQKLKLSNKFILPHKLLLLSQIEDEDQFQEEDDDKDNHFYSNETLQSIKENIIALFDWLTNEKKIKQQLIRSNLHLTQSMLIVSKENILRIQHRFQEIHIMLQIETLKRQLRQQFLQKLTPSFNHSLILTEHFSAIHPIVQQYKQKTMKTKEKIRRNQRGITPNAYSSSNKPKPPKYERLQGSVWNGTEYKYQLLSSLSHKLLMKLIFSAFSYVVSSNKIHHNAIHTLQHLSQKKILQLTFASLLYECISNQYIVLNSWLKVRSFIQTKYIFSTIKHWQLFVQQTIHYTNQQKIAYKHAQRYLFNRKGWIPFKQRMVRSHSRKIFALISKKIKDLMIYKKILLIWTLAMIQKQSLRQQLTSSSTSSAGQFKQTYYLSSQLHVNHSDSLQTNQQFTKYHIQQILHVQFLTILHQIQALFDGKYVLWSPCSTSSSSSTSRKYRFINKHIFLGSLNKVCQLPLLSQPSSSSSPSSSSIPSTEDNLNKQPSKQSLLQQTIRNQKRISLYQTQSEQPTQRFQQQTQQQTQLLQQMQSELQDIITNNTSTRYPIHSSSSSYPSTSSRYKISPSLNHQTNDQIDERNPSESDETSLNVSKSIIPKISYSNFPIKPSQSHQSLIERALEIHQDSLIASSVSKKTNKSFGIYSPNDDSDNESILDSDNNKNHNTREQQRQLREQQCQQLFQHFQIKRIDHMFALMRYFLHKLFKQTKYHQRFLHLKCIHIFRNKHQRFVQWKKLYDKILFQYQLVDTIASFKLLKQQFIHWKTTSYEYRSQQRQQLLQITNYYLQKSFWKKIKELYLSMQSFHFIMKQFQKRMKLYHWKQWKTFILQEKHYRLSIQRIEFIRVRKFWKFWFSKYQRKQLLKRVFSLSSHMQSMHKEYEQSIQLSNYQWLHTIFIAWKQYFSQKKEQCNAYKSLQIALEFRGLTLLSNMFDQWLIYTIQQRGVRQYQASQQRKLLTKVFVHWSNYIFNLQPNEENKLINNYQLQYIIHKYFQVWLRLYQYSNLIEPISRNNYQNIHNNNVSSPLPSAIKRLRPTSLTTSSSPTSPYSASNNSRLKISIPTKEAPVAPSIISQLQEQQDLLQYHIYHLQHKHLLLTKQQYFQVWKHEYALKQAYHQIKQHYQRKYLLKRPFWWWRVWRYQRSRYQQGFDKLNHVYNLFKLRRCFMNWPLRHGLMKMKELQLKIAERSVRGTRSRIELVDIEDNPNVLKRTLHPEESNKQFEPTSSTSASSSAIVSSSYHRNDGLQSLLQYRTKSFVRTAPKPLLQRALYYGYMSSVTDKVTYDKLVRLLTTILQYWSQYVDMSRRLRVLYIQLRGLRRLRILERLLFHWIALTPRISYRVITWLNSMKRRAHDEYMFHQYGTRGIDNFQPAKITKQSIEFKER